jgi:uncharacterized protein (DUF983 family)
MSVEETDSSETISSPSPPRPEYIPSANYMACRRCGEGSIIYDSTLKMSRCRACGESVLPEELRG